MDDQFLVSLFHQQVVDEKKQGAQKIKYSLRITWLTSKNTNRKAQIFYTATFIGELQLKNNCRKLPL